MSISQKNQRVWKWMLITFLGVMNADKRGLQDLPSGSVVKNLPCNAGDMGLIPGQGTKNPQTASN